MKESQKHLFMVIGGYAFLLVFFGLFTGRVNLLFFGANAQETFPAYAHSAEIGQICCLFLISLLARVRRRISERIAPYLALTLLVAGYALTLYQTVDAGTKSTAFSLLAGTLFGAGQGACFLCWFMIYDRLSELRVIQAMVASTLLSGGILALIGCISNTVALFSALSIVVAGCISLMYACLNSIPERTRTEVSQKESSIRTSGQRIFSWAFLERRSLLCLLAIAFVCGAQRVISLEWFIPQSAVQILFSIGYIGGALIFWIANKLPQNKNGYYGIYSLLLAVMATCGVLSSVQNVLVQTVLYGVDNVAFALVSMCMIMTALRAVDGFFDNPLFVGGIVCGSMYFAIQLGRVVCNRVVEAIGMDAIGILIVSVIILYVLALAGISSGIFFRQAAKGGGIMVPNKTGEAGVAEKPAQYITISVANITEDEFRKNPVYHQQYKLTDREIDVALLLLAGYNSADIAKILVISVNTVKTHLKNLYAKMGIHNRRELIDLLNMIEGENNEPRINRSKQKWLSHFFCVMRPVLATA